MAVKINNIEYSGFFFNGEALTAMYLNGNKVYGSESQPQYSITLTPVEWVSNENISTRIWLDLGYVWKNNSRAQLGFVIPGTHQKPNGQQVFGEDTVWASDGNGPVNDNDDLRLFFTKSGSNIGAYWDVATSRIQATIGAITDVWQDWEIGNNYIKNLSNNTNFVTGSTYNISRTGTVGLYGACQYLNTGRTDCVRYSYVKIYEGDTLVKDIIPVLDNNNIPCFFDKISEELIYYKVNGEPSTGLTAGNATGSTIKIVYSESSVTISNSSTSGITVGNTFNLNASAVPTGSTLTYTSSNPSVASVDSNGIVSGVASGNTTITITASEVVDDENRIVYRSGSTTVNLSVEEASQPFNPLTDSKYFVIQARSATTLTIESVSSPSGTTAYRKNGTGSWTTANIDANTDISLNQGDYLEFKGNIHHANNKYYRFKTSVAKSIDCGGWLAALEKNAEIDSTNNTVTHAFCCLFSGCTGLVNAQDLKLPDNTTENMCRTFFRYCSNLVTAPELPANGTIAVRAYQYMFADCTSLITAPVLPASAVSQNSYYYMFARCRNLVTPPDLPATTLGTGCYSYMFSNCVKLESAPTLPATTLAQECYNFMFQNCRKLVTGPYLPAKKLAWYCYCYMFYGCSALTSLRVGLEQITASSALDSWLDNITTAGICYCPSSATYSASDIGLPSTWTLSKTLSS